jgi:1,4-alpha-glucan branching enzyme
VSNAAIRVVEFTFIAPSASHVSLVGEFNGWDPAATPMARSAAGEWRVRLPLGGGRHVYAFVVDGAAWMPDPRAPLAAERWFGSPNSVLLVGGGGSL